MVETSFNKDLVLTDVEKRMLQLLKNIKPKRLKVFNNIFTSSSAPFHFCQALNLTQLQVNPDATLSFCCNIIGNGKVLGSLKQSSLYGLIEKAMEISTELKKIRLKHIRENNFLRDFIIVTFVIVIYKMIHYIS